VKNRQLIGLLFAVLIFLLVISLPVFASLETKGRRCLALFAAVFVLYIFEALPVAVVSLAIVPLLVILRITDIKSALDGFSSSSTYLVTGSFILAAAMLKTGIGKRITCFMLLKIGTQPTKISLGFAVANVVMAFLIPSSTARTAMFLPLCISVINEYTGENKRVFAANLLLTQCVTSSTISAGILTSTITNPLATEYILNATGRVVTFAEWFTWGFPAALIMTAVSWGIIQLFFRVGKGGATGGHEFLHSEMLQLGKITAAEKKCVIVISLTVLMWVFGNTIGIDPTTTVLFSSILLFMPGFRVLEWRDCQDNINLSVIFLVSGGISLGAAMNSTGTASWLAQFMFSNGLEKTSAIVIVIAVIVIVQFMHFFFMGTATMANAFFPILIGIALNIGISAENLVIPAAFMIGGYPVLAFFNTTPNILCYDTGYIKSSDFIRIGIPISIVACALYVLCAYWYWPLVGLL